MSLLHYRAGSEALVRLRTQGLSPAELSAVVLPAIGPKWLVLSGFDRALVEAGWFAAQPQKLWLFGASVGAWRALALAAHDPRKAHARLLESYCQQRFTTADTPDAISGAYRQLLEQVISPEDLQHALQHPRLELAIATVRARGLCALEQPGVQPLALGAAGLLHAFGARAAGLCFERVVFATGSGVPLLQAAGSSNAALNERNLREVALASGTVPMYMRMVRDVPGAKPGAYLDGGFSDYHLNRTATAGPGLSLMFLHQRRIIPAWFDKFVPWRKPKSAWLARLLLVYPSQDFVRSLPGGAIPTREDFKRFVHEPEARIARWQQVVARSQELAAAFLDDVASGEIARQAQPLD